jgi:hypothetical protein
VTRLSTFAVFVALLTQLHGQINTSTVAGSVSDESGAAVPNATIVLTESGTGLRREAVSSESGEFAVPQLAPGRYRVTASAPGFTTGAVEDINLSIAERATVQITLKVGAVTEEVTVVGTSAPLIEQETASLGQVITRKAINDLPLNGRNYLQLGVLSPGVIPQIPASAGPASFIAATTQRSDRSILVGGQRESSTSYLYDGVEMRNPRIGDTSLTPSLDAIQEFKIQRNFFQAEFGNSPAVINVASRGGTNEYHGSVFYFLRNNAMDARNFFARQVEPFKRNQFGFALGGPLVRDKVFFFANYEGFRQRLGVIQRGIFPWTRLLEGDFSGLPTIYDPLTFSDQNMSRTPFPGNRIPAERINRVSRNFFQYIPLAGGPPVGGANLEGTPVQRLDEDQFTIRGDWLISANHSLFGRYSWQDSPLIPAALQPLGGRAVLSQGKSAVAQVTSTLTTSVVNVVRVAYSFMNLYGQQVPVDRDIVSELGLTGLSTVQRNWGVPNVGWQGFSGIGSDGLTQGNTLHNYQVSEALTWVKGGHTIKAGAEVKQSRNALNSDNSPRGSFTFNASYTALLDPVTGNPTAGTGHPVADFLLGHPTNMSGAVGSSFTHFRFHTVNLFLQDDWKISREWTLNYGLRWEYLQPPAPIEQERGNVYGFDFNTGRQLFPILGQIRDSIIEPDYHNFAPRVGFAYNPSWGQSWVFRGGAGIYYDQAQMNETQFITNGPPIFRQQNYNTTGRGLPPFTFGVNTLPVAVIPPIDANYQTPPGTLLFAQEIDGRKPREYMWNFSIQKSIAANWVIEAAYIGARGVRLSKRYNAYANATPGVLYDVTPGVATRYPNLSGMLYSSLAGWSKYHALNLRMERRFSSGLSLLGAYTFGKSIDTDSGGAWGTPNLNPANFQLDVGPSDFDIRHRFVASAIYELPFGRGRRWGTNWSTAAQAFLGGWQINAIPSWQSGVPRIVSSPNTSTLAFISQRADAVGTDPYGAFDRGGQSIDPGDDFGGANAARFWINPTAFRQTAPLKFGTSGRNIIYGPAAWNWDLSLFKNFDFTERVRLQLRGEAFNAFNNVRFFPPELNIVSPNFGTLQNADRPRVMQVAMRLTF